jgi:hypothetical protein
MRLIRRHKKLLKKLVWAPINHVKVYMPEELPPTAIHLRLRLLLLNRMRLETKEPLPYLNDARLQELLPYLNDARLQELLPYLNDAHLANHPYLNDAPHPAALTQPPTQAQTKEKERNLGEERDLKRKGNLNKFNIF